MFPSPFSGSPESPRPEIKKQETKENTAIEKQEQKEIGDILDETIERLLCEQATKLNEGNNGIILRIRVKDIAPEVRQWMTQNGIELGNEYAMKLLKIYSASSIEQEYSMQCEAKRIVDNAPANLAHATVPAAHFCRNLAISEETRIQMKHMLGRETGESVSVMLMDFVEGDDLMTHLLKEVLQRHPGSLYRTENSDFKGISFEELFADVQTLCHFETPGGKAGDVGEREYEKQKVQNTNAKKLITTIKKLGYVLDPEIITQIRNTLELFHKSGFYFRDGHQRNFMLTPKPEGGFHVNIVDFGSSKKFDGPVPRAQEEEIVYTDKDNRRYYPDEYIIRFLEELLPEVQGPKTVLNLEKLKKNPLWIRHFSVLDAASGQANFTDVLQKTYNFFHSSDTTNLKIFLGMIEQLVEEKKMTREQSNVFWEAKMPMLNLAQQNMIREFIKAPPSV